MFLQSLQEGIRKRIENLILLSYNFKNRCNWGNPSWYCHTNVILYPLIGFFSETIELMKNRIPKLQLSSGKTARWWEIPRHILYTISRRKFLYRKSLSCDSIECMSSNCVDVCHQIIGLGNSTQEEGTSFPKYVKKSIQYLHCSPFQFRFLEITEKDCYLVMSTQPKC